MMFFRALKEFFSGSIPADRRFRSLGMPSGDIEVIRRYAAGDGLLREAAVDAYRRNMPDFRHANSEMNFMGEVDTPVPDLMLRGRYRQMLASETRDPKLAEIGLTSIFAS